MLLCCCLFVGPAFVRAGCGIAAAATAAGDPVRRIGERSEAPPQRSSSSAYLSLSFALSIISLSMKALLLECSCKILLANELILNVIVCVRPVEGLPVANRDPGVIFSLSIFIFLVVVLNDTRPWAECRLYFLPKPARPKAEPASIRRPLQCYLD